jgi:hypothetical protein
MSSQSHRKATASTSTPYSAPSFRSSFFNSVTNAAPSSRRSTHGSRSMKPRWSEAELILVRNTHIRQQLHGNSASNSFTISLDTVSEPSGRFTTRNPLIGSTTYSFTRFGTPCGVSTMLSPLTSQTRRTPGAQPSLLRTSRGSTTCPLLESRVVITGGRCHHERLATSKNVLLSWVVLEWRYRKLQRSSLLLPGGSGHLVKLSI